MLLSPPSLVHFSLAPILGCGQPVLEPRPLFTTDPYESIADSNTAVSFRKWSGVTHSNRHPMDRILALKLTVMDLHDPI